MINLTIPNWVRFPVLISLLIFASCGGKGIKYVPADPDLAEKMALRMESEFLEGNSALFDSLVDVDYLLWKGIRGASMSKKEMESQIEKATPSFNYGESIAEVALSGMDFRLIRMRKGESPPKALFRVISKEGIFNYIEFYFERQEEEGKSTIRITDIYDYALGGLISETSHEMTLALESLPDDEKGTEKEFWMEKCHEIMDGIQSGNYREVLEIYDLLPRELQENQRIMLYRLQAASKLEPELFSKVGEEYLEAFPDNTSTFLVLAEYLIAKKRFKEYRTFLVKFEKRLGGRDAMTGVMWSFLFYMDTEDWNACIDMLKPLIVEDPGVEGAYWSLVACQVEKKNYEGAMKTIEILLDKFSYLKREQINLADFPELMASDAYKEWMKKQE